MRLNFSACSLRLNSILAADVLEYRQLKDRIKDGRWGSGTFKHCHMLVSVAKQHAKDSLKFHEEHARW